MSGRCVWVLGPCVDGAQAGRRCDAPTASGDRCERHTFGRSARRGEVTPTDEVMGKADRHFWA